MKVRCIKADFDRYLSKNKWQIFSVVLFLVAGVLLGAYMSVSMEGEETKLLGSYINNFVSAYNLQNLNLFDVFKFSVYSNIKTVLFVSLSGLWIGFLPLLFLQVGAKGYKFGFSIAMLVKRFGLKGAIFAILSSFPQVFIFIPLFVFYAVFNINFAFFQKQKHTTSVTSRMKTEIYIKNLSYLLVMIAASFLVAAFDAYIVPQILKPLCAVWGKY